MGKSNRVSKFLGQKAYERAAAIGAAGPNGRARTIPSKRDKANDAKRQRKRKDWERE